MNFDRSHFFLMTAAIAAGGVGGWVVRDQDALAAFMPHVTGVEPVAAVAETVPTAPPAPTLPALPACDDSTGVAEACPAMGPAAEGVCSNASAKRCADFKAAFKPKVAANAVACIRNLKGAELCDVSRANICGHSALMAACQEVTDPGAQNATPSVVATACERVVKGCSGTPLSPTMNECQRTLAGMNDAGRASMVSCMATHCGDRGLLGCEALTEPTAHAG